SATELSEQREPVKRLSNDIADRIMDKATEMAPLMNELGRRALAKIATLMESAGKEEVQLRAAIDLADHSPETTKTQRLDVTSLSLSGQDAKELAEVLVESARAREKFSHVAEHGLEEIV